MITSLFKLSPFHVVRHYHYHCLENKAKWSKNMYPIRQLRIYSATQRLVLKVREAAEVIGEMSYPWLIVSSANPLWGICTPNATSWICWH
jgi:hypothetical protein